MATHTKTMVVASAPQVPSRSGSLQPVLVVLLIVASFLLGALWTEVRYLKRGGAATSPTTTAGTAQPTQPAQPQFGSADNLEKLKETDHVRGNRNAQILMIEYSDLECPFCKSFHPTAQRAVDEYDGKVAWVYRHFPLDQIHSKADKEAEAVECANELAGNDGYWKLTDKIFSVTPSNNGLNLDDLPKLASDVGLNQSSFKNCLDSGKYAAHVEEDYQSGIKAGITGTPGTVLLNTKTNKTRLVPGAVPYEQLKQAIDALLSES